MKEREREMHGDRKRNRVHLKTKHNKHVPLIQCDFHSIIENITKTCNAGKRRLQSWHHLLGYTHSLQTKTTKKKGKVARKPCNNGVFNKVGRDKRLYLEKDHAEMSSPVELTSMLMLTQ